MKNYIALVAIKMINNENFNVNVSLRLEKEPTIENVVSEILKNPFVKVSQLGVINTSFISQIMLVEFKEDK